MQLTTEKLLGEEGERKNRGERNQASAGSGKGQRKNKGIRRAIVVV